MHAVRTQCKVLDVGEYNQIWKSIWIFITTLGCCGHSYYVFCPFQCLPLCWGEPQGSYSYLHGSRVSRHLCAQYARTVNAYTASNCLGVCQPSLALGECQWLTIKAVFPDIEWPIGRVVHVPVQCDKVRMRCKQCGGETNWMCSACGNSLDPREVLQGVPQRVAADMQVSGHRPSGEVPSREAPTNVGPCKS